MLRMVRFKEIKKLSLLGQFFYFFSFLLTEVGYYAIITYCNISIIKKELINFN